MLGETSRAGFLRYIGLPAKRALRLQAAYVYFEGQQQTAVAR
jgi:hypothetical protein